MDPLKGATALGGMRKSAKMTARISLAFAVLALLVLVVSIANFGPSPSTPFLSGLCLFFFLLFWFNRGYAAYVTSYLLCTAPSVVMLVMTLLLKEGAPGDDLHYFDSRLMLVAFCALPGMVLSQREPYLLYSAVAVTLLCLAVYDPLHEWAGVGYYQGGFTNPTYYHINTVALAAGLSITAGTLVLKGIVLGEEARNEVLLEEEEARNQELETQNEEITSQTEQLAAAFATIERQRNALENHATLLEETVRVKSADLKRSNDELQKSNGELMQFSYTVSHNVRGPIARLLGLTSLIDKDDPQLSDDNRRILALVQESSLELDTVIRELSRIIEIRNDLYTVKEKIVFAEEWAHVRNSLQGQFVPDMAIETDFAAPFMYTIRPFFHSILYNLVSNAIRYRSPQRPLRIRIQTVLRAGVMEISVADNGLGINLQQFGNNLFGMYKRFHTHVEGRGLGLFLVKTQVEALQGTVRVESELNKGTTFFIDIRLPHDIEGQVCFDCDYGTVLYNARINAMGLAWKRPVTSQEYRFLLTKCLEMLHVYKTPRWIADLRKRGTVAADDYRWFGDAILNEGSKNGLATIACIDDVEQNPGQEQEMIRVASRFGIDMKFFTARNHAESWIEQS